ncbi:hypothetical protein AVEN_225406-1 [Araneus ventricosus]|uniref:Uncharacterized protein n=1 Tax=Araneus ventricosus TaxID=182803 RepID=A0A4Y2PQ88_ARAVE|nr:hypothetical protein AVEN_225406-1 [Araneus ventricosus]
MEEQRVCEKFCQELANLYTETFHYSTPTSLERNFSAGGISMNGTDVSNRTEHPPKTNLKIGRLSPSTDDIHCDEVRALICAMIIQMSMGFL